MFPTLNVICLPICYLLSDLLKRSLFNASYFFVTEAKLFCLLTEKKKSPTDVWNQSFIAEYYIKHCSQDLTSLKTIIVQQLCYNTQYGI